MIGTRTSILALVAALATTGACQNDTARKADRAADKLVQQTEHRRTAEPGADNGISPQVPNIPSHEDELTKASDDFALRREIRIVSLTAQHDVIASQAPVIETLATALPFSDAGQSSISEKLTLFRLRLNDTQVQIDALREVPAAEFPERDDLAGQGMSKLEEARAAAWKALADAPRLDRTSSL